MKKSGIFFLLALGLMVPVECAQQDTLKPSFLKKLSNDQLRSYYKEAKEKRNRKLEHQVAQELKARGAQLEKSKRNDRSSERRNRRPEGQRKTPNRNISGRTQQNPPPVPPRTDLLERETPPPVPPREEIIIPNPPPLPVAVEPQGKTASPSLAEQLRAGKTKLRQTEEVSTEKVPSAKMRWDNLKAQGDIEQLRIEKMELSKQMAQAGLRVGMSPSKENKERFEQLEVDYDYVNSLLPEDAAINEDDDIEWA